MQIRQWLIVAAFFFPALFAWLQPLLADLGLGA